MSDNKLIVAAMRDEGPYLLEWIAYHRVIGFTGFLVYSNDCRDGTDLMLERLDQLGIVTHQRNKVLRRGPQKSAYRHAMDHPDYLTADWVAFLDADEFLNIKLGGGLLGDLLARFPEADAIPVCWRLFSDCGHEGLVDGLTLDTYTDAETEESNPADPRRFVKSLFRPTPNIQRVGLHTPEYNPEVEKAVNWGCVWTENDPTASPGRPDANWGYEVAQVNHYALRSPECFMLKRDRGDAVTVKDKLNVSYWKRWCRGGIKDRSILRHRDALLGEMAQLCEDPVLCSLDAAAKEVHQNRLRELLKQKEWRKLLAEVKVLRRPPPTPSLPQPVKASRYANRRRMLERMPKRARCAEIGVWKGEFSAQILELTQPSELVLIDPWDLIAEQPKNEQTHRRHSNADHMAAMYDHVRKSYAGVPEITVQRGFSKDILGSYPDGYFDWVYIDGNHRYDFVRKDLELSFKKVRRGGIVAGDDFFWKLNNRMHVREAVLDAMRAFEIPGRPSRLGQQYMITVPQE